MMKETLTSLAVGISLVTLALWVMFSSKRNFVKVNNVVWSRNMHKYMAHCKHMLVLVFSTICWLLSLLSDGSLVTKSLYTVTLVAVFWWEIYDSRCLENAPKQCKIVAAQVSVPQGTSVTVEKDASGSVVIKVAGVSGARGKGGGNEPVTIALTGALLEAVTINMAEEKRRPPQKLKKIA
ncbi:hypothetical protein [Ktedonospora formicarum]|nr:hypothetical protein [Ktedonospora formicarum]